MICFPKKYHVQCSPETISYLFTNWDRVIIFLSVRREWREHVVWVFILVIAVVTLVHKPGQDDLDDWKNCLKYFFTVASPRL